MKLLEYKGKELFKAYGIAVPGGRVVSTRVRKTPLPVPFVLKSQVASGDRMKKGGIVFIDKPSRFLQQKEALFALSIDGKKPQKLLAEPNIQYTAEYYVSISFDTNTRTPTLALSGAGGTGVTRASLTTIYLTGPAAPLTNGSLPDFFIRSALQTAGIPVHRPLLAVIQSLWKLFSQEKAILAEINPLFELPDGTYVAGDAKVILDDHVVDPDYRPYISLDGDIAVLASGGGASMINLDALIRAGGRPANYVEYSGNPKSGVVGNLTKKVLSRPGLKGCWVIGGTANFTDIYETLKGFAEGLKAIRPVPAYPIVVRRDGPRREEAFAMLENVKKTEGYNIHLFGPEVPMAETARTMVKLAYKKRQ